MESTVNDFLSEINEIAPLSTPKTSTNNSYWEKCFDDNSGYYYYWNTKTNEVTWDKPAGFKSPRYKSEKKPLYVPPRAAPLFPSTSQMPDVRDSVKIYKIAENANIKKENKEDELKYAKKLPFKRPKSDSDDEKIVLISSYGGDSEDSEDEREVVEKKKINGFGKPQNEAPLEPQNESRASPSKDCNTKTNEISGFSLVAGYGSESEEETEEKQEISHSTLFPAVKPINIKDFEPKIEEKNDFDTKAFQRKRRIGIDLSSTKKIKVGDEEERRGFGYTESKDKDNDISETKIESGNIYPGFKSGGLMFVKTEVLNPQTKNPENESVGKDLEDTYTTLKEKLGFLSEGKETVSPVQVMLIQIETLMVAAKAGDLKSSYLKKWLEDTCSDLIKLEKETTPEGWLLKWDRHHKRYYYQNETSGESQWDYPESDVTRRDEEMDICTTPPPNNSLVEQPELSPPQPPKIKSPTPPPPPSISTKTNRKKCDIPLPPEPVGNNGEPLPPGVDVNEVPQSSMQPEKDDLNEELSSFYSDIAAIETNSPTPPPSEDKKEADANELKKKKVKSKVKLTQGIAMKKKGVSKLVEKWKNVQMSYKD